VLALVACGSKAAPSTTSVPAADTHLASAGDALVALLPPEPQLVVEIDLARLRANATVGKLATRLVADDDPREPGASAFPAIDAPPSLLASADVVVVAAYGVGTSDAAMITLVQLTAGTTPEGGRAIRERIVGVGPDAWLDQVVVRAQLPGVRASKDLYDLRDHAMPPKAPGAALRVTARLSFDARIALARMTGLEAAPERLSVWGDVVDDLALIVDADGGKDEKATRATLAQTLGALAREPAVLLVGLRGSIERARISEHGKTWVRAILAVGPTHLQRAVQRAEGALP